MGEVVARRRRAGEQRGLGADLRLERGGRERGGLDDPGARGPPGARVDQVPAAARDAARGGRAVGQRQLGQDLVVPRARDRAARARRRPRGRRPGTRSRRRAAPRSRSATRSAARPLPSPPLSSATPGGRETASASTDTCAHRRCGSGIAGRGSPAGARSFGVRTRARRWRRPGRRSARRRRARRRPGAGRGPRRERVGRGSSLSRHSSERGSKRVSAACMRRSRASATASASGASRPAPSSATRPPKTSTVRACSLMTARW